MIQSGDAAEQLVRLSLEGAEVAVKLTGAAAKEIAMFLLAALKSPEKNGKIKLKGKERLTSMLKSGKPLEIFSVKERDLARFARGAKQYGIVYCVLRNSKNSPDGLCDVMVKADDAPKISRLIERFKFATVDKAKIESELLSDIDIPVPASPLERKTAPNTDMPRKDPTDRLLDELLGTADTGNREPSGAKPDTPVVGEIQKEMGEIIGTKEGKAEPETPLIPTEPAKPEPVKPGKETVAKPPFARSAPTPPPSEPTSESRKRPGGITASKPSVKTELREITAAQRKRETDAPKHPIANKPKKAPAVTTHNQPPRGGKPKPKKSREGR